MRKPRVDLAWQDKGKPAKAEDAGEGAPYESDLLLTLFIPQVV